MKTKYLSILCILIFLFVWICYKNFFEASEEDRALNKVLSKIEENFKKDYNLSFSGLGGSSPNGLSLISLRFTLSKPLTKGEARRLIIEVSNKILNTINSEDKLIPFLRDYPFSKENLDIAIFSENEDQSDTFDPFIAVVSSSDDITYRTNDPNSNRYKSRISESFVEANAIIEKEKQNLRRETY